MPNRRSRTVRCERHASGTYQPFLRAAQGAARKGGLLSDGPAVTGKVTEAVLQTLVIPGLTCDKCVRLLSSAAHSPSRRLCPGGPAALEPAICQRPGPARCCLALAVQGRRRIASLSMRPIAGGPARVAEISQLPGQHPAGYPESSPGPQGPAPAGDS